MSQKRDVSTRLPARRSPRRQHNEFPKVPLSALRGIAIEAPDDLYDLARLIVKIQRGHEKRHPREVVRTTLNGLANIYVYVTHWHRNAEPIRSIIEDRGLPLGGTIEPGR